MAALSAASLITPLGALRQMHTSVNPKPMQPLLPCLPPSICCESQAPHSLTQNEADQRANITETSNGVGHNTHLLLSGGCTPPLVITLGALFWATVSSLWGNTDAQAAQGETLHWPVAFKAVPLYRSQDSAYHRTYHEAAVSFLRTWAKTSTTTGHKATGKTRPDRGGTFLCRASPSRGTPHSRRPSSA